MVSNFDLKHSSSNRCKGSFLSIVYECVVEWLKTGFGKHRVVFVLKESIFNSSTKIVKNITHYKIGILNPKLELFHNFPRTFGNCVIIHRYTKINENQKSRSEGKCFKKLIELDRIRSRVRTDNKLHEFINACMSKSVFQLTFYLLLGEMILNVTVSFAINLVPIL